MVSITSALQRIKDDPRAAIGSSVVESVCRELGLEWRNTSLTPPVTIALLAQHGIEAQGGYSPLHLNRTDDATLPNTVSLWRRVLCLPLETRPKRGRPITRGAAASAKIPRLDHARFARE